MKIGIISLYGENNYGNKFQNYALKTTLEKYCNDVETVVLDEFLVKKNISHYIKVFSFKIVFQYLSSKRRSWKRKKTNKYREQNMKAFSEKYLNVKRYQLYKTELEKIHGIYDKLVIGSDQVWNHHFVRSDLDWYFATFSPKEKNIAYSASFGVDSTEEELHNEYIKGLNNISHISVREDQGAKIIKDLTGMDVPVLVDPTMLLTPEEWDKVSVEPNVLPKRKYILTYFLGNYSDERKEYIYNFAQNHNMDVINLARTEYKEFYAEGPSEFLWYIKHASMMVTDSFHGTVFSLLYRIPFYIMNRDDKMQSMSSRIDTLLGKFNLREREVHGYKFDMHFECDFKNIDEVLKMERERSFNYLNEALGLKEN